MYEQRLKELNITLPPCPEPAGTYISGIQTGNLVFVSGQTPIVNGEPLYPGKVDSDVSIEDAYKASRVAMLICLSQLRTIIGTLDNVKKVVKVNGWVNSVSTLKLQPKVINGASDLLITLFGENGRHARAAMGVNSLPGNACVEIELVVEVV